MILLFTKTNLIQDNKQLESNPTDASKDTPLPKEFEIYTDAKDIQALKALTPEQLEKAKTEVKKFINFVIDDLLHKNYTKGVVPETFLNALSLDASTLSIAKKVAENDEDLTTFTINSIRDKLSKIDADTAQIEESFFFYPIVGFMKALSIEINKQD